MAAAVHFVAAAFKVALALRAMRSFCPPHEHNTTEQRLCLGHVRCPPNQGWGWYLWSGEKFNSSPISFKSDKTFEIYLAETLTSSPDEIHLLEERYLSKFSTHIRKCLYIMQIHPPWYRVCFQQSLNPFFCSISAILPKDWSYHPLPN